MSFRWINCASNSTVVASHIAPPSDSQLLNDGVRVISRLLAKSKTETGVKVRFTDKCKAANSLAFQIFNAKKATKDELYLELLKMARLVAKQADRGQQQVSMVPPPSRNGWTLWGTTES